MENVCRSSFANNCELIYKSKKPPSLINEFLTAFLENDLAHLPTPTCSNNDAIGYGFLNLSEISRSLTYRIKLIASM